MWNVPERAHSLKIILNIWLTVLKNPVLTHVVFSFLFFYDFQVSENNIYHTVVAATCSWVDTNRPNKLVTFLFDLKI